MTALSTNSIFKSQKRASSSHILPIIISLLLLLTSIHVLQLIPPVQATTRIVPSASYPTIQSAIDAAKRGDTIQVSAGTYYENLIVNVVQLKIIGANKYTTIIDGNGTGSPVTLSANEVTITGFTINDNGSQNYGVKTYGFNTHNITNNIIENQVDGIYFLESSSNIIKGNTFFNNSMHGINLGNSIGTQITDNIISDSAFGVYLSYSNSTQVLRNKISGTSYGIYSLATTLNTFTNNTISNSSCGIITSSSDNLAINSNTITGGMYSIQMQRTHNSQLVNNTVNGASYGYGIYLVSSNLNTVGGTRGNLIAKYDWGLVLYNSSNNQIKDGNTIAQNTWGIYVVASSNGNTIYHNNFVNNIKQAFQDIGNSNTWDNGAEGNYWNDYNGYPPAEGVDYRPIAQPWPMRNLAITSVTPSKTQFYPGEAVTVSVNVKNFGVITEIAKVTAYYGSTAIGTKTTTLTASATQLLNFNWNTLNVPVGNHIISATVEPIPYVERNYTDNTLTDGTVQVGLQGDINADHIVNRQDLILLQQAYGSTPGSSNWYPNADLNQDNIIDKLDLFLLSKNYGKTA